MPDIVIAMSYVLQAKSSSFRPLYFPRLFWYCDMIEVISHKPDSRGEDVKSGRLDQTPAVHRAVVRGCGGHRGTDGREDPGSRSRIRKPVWCALVQVAMESAKVFWAFGSVAVCLDV